MQDNAIIKPIKRKSLIQSDIAILVSAEPDIKSLIKVLDLQNIQKKKLMMSSVYTGKTNNLSVLVTGPMIGAPYATLILEEIIAAGIQTILFLGWCGSLSEKVRIGDCIVPEASLIDEGTSRCYPGSSEQSEPDLAQADLISKALKRNGHPSHKGKIWCTDGFYQETPEKISNFQLKKAIGVEMETSALFTVAHYRKVSLAAVLIVSDELHQNKWLPGFSKKEFEKGRHSSFLAIQQWMTERGESK